MVDAIEDGEGKPCAAVCEELGDVLMNILMASVIASESGAFEIGAVVSGILEKLIRRHPHVFEDEKAENAEEVLELWNSIKEEEKRGRGESGEVSRLDSVHEQLVFIQRKRTRRDAKVRRRKDSRNITTRISASLRLCVSLSSSAAHSMKRRSKTARSTL